MHTGMGVQHAQGAVNSGKSRARGPWDGRRVRRFNSYPTWGVPNHGGSPAPARGPRRPNRCTRSLQDSQRMAPARPPRRAPARRRAPAAPQAPQLPRSTADDASQAAAAAVDKAAAAAKEAASVAADKAKVAASQAVDKAKETATKLKGAINQASLDVDISQFRERPPADIWRA